MENESVKSKRNQIKHEITRTQFHALIKKAAQPIKNLNKSNKIMDTKEVKYEVV